MSPAAGPPGAGDDVLVPRENAILIVTINRPQQRNAVNGAVSAGIAAALDQLDREPDLRVGVLHGTGTAFCAGMDLKAFATSRSGSWPDSGTRRPRSPRCVRTRWSPSGVSRSRSG